MRLSFILALVMGLVAGTAIAAERAPLRPASSAPAEDPNGARVIVKYKALGSLMKALAASGRTRGPQAAATLGQRSGLSLSDGHIIGPRTQVIRGDRSLTSAALAARLGADADVEYAVPDLRRHALAVPDDPLYAASSSISPTVGQWYLQAPSSSAVSAINAPGAWNFTIGAASVVVADVDTGVRFDHPDLASKLYAGRNFVSTDGTTGDGWSADASDPGDWTTAGECGTGDAATDSSWHGTQTSGLIGAATDNAVGMASIGYDTMVLPVRVLGPCGGYDSDIIAGMLWAAGLALPGTDPSVPSNPHPAQIINLSLGSSGSCPASYADAIAQLTAAGVVVVAAAGNDEGLAVVTPANCSGVIAVAGLRQAGTKVGYSDIGPEIALSAPAGNCVNTTGACLYPILSTTNSGTTTPSSNTYTDSSNPSLGTSFSTPLVAGTAALMLAANPSLTPAEVKSLLQSSATAFPTTSSDAGVVACHAPNGVTQDECICTTSTCGAGMLNAAAAVAAAAGTALPTASISASATTVTAGGTVTLDASASSAPSGRTVASYAWSIASGSGIASFSGATDSKTATLATHEAGSVTVELTVTDSSGAQATKTLAVTVHAAAAPTVSVTASATVVGAGTPVTFDGADSTAASGLTIASYAWTIASGATLASFTSATDESTAGVATTAAGSGTFTVTLTVTDSAGTSASKSTTVTVNAVQPTASISTPATSVAAGSSVTFDGSASIAAGGRTIAGYRWAITSGATIAAFSGGTTAAQASVTTSGAGSFTVQLTVTDSAGVSATQTSTITVTAAATASSSTTSSSSSSGGGAIGVEWLVLLLAALAALVATRKSRAAPR
ncbi:MAG: S8 family serine peptidase [Proteobacteria bacterium]|nr:S8 family serine peptidase [Pseudomonadota bacterium]